VPIAARPTPNLVCVLLSASPSMVGGYRGLQALRIPLETMGVIVLPDMFALAQAKTPEDVDRLTGAAPAGPRLTALCAAFLDTALAMRPIADRRR
jgi:NAD(P)H-dependent FMN reductase